MDYHTFWIVKLKTSIILTFQMGLSGSSAIVCAALSCLLDFYKVRHLVKVEVRPNLILSAEMELGIVAGLQDRVAQVYGGLVYMVCNMSHWKYKRAYSAHLPFKDINCLEPLERWNSFPDKLFNPHNCYFPSFVQGSIIWKWDPHFKKINKEKKKKKKKTNYFV